jgi:hypothetical protein
MKNPHYTTLPRLPEDKSELAIGGETPINFFLDEKVYKKSRLYSIIRSATSKRIIATG